MSNSEVSWHHAGISEVKDGRIRIPDKVFNEAGILTPGQPVHWSYEKVVKILIVSNQPLEADEYETVDFRKLGDGSDNYRCTIPNAFFDDKAERGEPAVSPSVPEKARVKEGERRHFMFTSDMAEGMTKSCYVFTDAEFSDRFRDSEIWDGALDQVPQFF